MSLKVNNIILYIFAKKIFLLNKNINIFEKINKFIGGLAHEAMEQILGAPS